MKNFSFENRKFLILFLFLSVLSLAQTGLKITYYDGTEQGFAVQDSGKLYFSGANLMIEPDASTTATSIPVNIIQKIVFDNSVLGVQNVSGKDLYYILYPNPSNDYIRIKSLKGEKINVSIYATDGKQLLNGQYSSDQNIDVSRLNSGVYLIKANNQTFKLIKK